VSVLEIVAKKWLADVYWFSRLVVRRPLRNYQLAPARAIVDSVLHQRGLEFAVMFPRQSGKNETQGQVEAYLLNLFQRVPGATIVKAQPSMKPQGQNAMGRLQRTLRNDWNTPRTAWGAGRPQWHSANGYQVVLGEATATFFSANPDAHTVGATATLLLECDEAQDVLEAEWEKKFIPMAASTNATVVYWGTAWTSRTLLAKVIRHLREQERQDGIRRVFIVTPEQVAEENPLYGEFVARQVEKKGRQHPLIRTQFFNEEIDAEGGMFPPARRALMQGTHPRRDEPEPGTAGHRPVYALLLDVAGEDEGAVGERTDSAALENPKRDATVLTIVEVDLSTLADPVLQAPTYRCVSRRLWVGVKHSTLYGILRATAQAFGARYLVADATGVGAGLVSFLAHALPAGVVIPFEFNSSSKSKLGWDFIGIVEAGRWQEWRSDAGSQKSDGALASDIQHGLSSTASDVQSIFWHELEFVQYEVVPGPAHLLRWGVPDGTRDPATAELVHDDTVLSAALCAVLDEQPWAADTGPGTVLSMPDPLATMEKGF